MRRNLVIWLLALSATQAVADPPSLPDGETAPPDHAAQADLHRTAADLERAARSGHRLAAYTLAMMMARGQVPSPDSTAIWRWLRQAATAGLADAQFAFGQLYDRGIGVPRAPGTARHYYTLAARQGHLQAQITLGTLYFIGDGVAKDDVQAARWYLAAAQAGDAGAQYIVAHMYEHGYGLPHTLAEARQWYALAARQGDPVAASRLANLIAADAPVTPSPDRPATPQDPGR